MEYEALKSFFDGYLHQDWDSEYETPFDAATDFGAKEEFKRITQAIGEGQILLWNCEQRQVNEFLRNSGWCTAEGQSATDWLQSILRAIASSVPNSGFSSE